MNKPFVRSLCLATIAFVACAPTDEAQRLVGQLESDRVEITAEFSEPILERMVAEGEQVSIGQLLIRQDTSRVETRVAEADATVKQTRARLAELIRGPRKELIVAAKANVDGAQTELEFRETVIGHKLRGTLHRQTWIISKRDLTSC
jgi:HlyD family secretion protein